MSTKNISMCAYLGQDALWNVVLE
nr:unnamed protein product [Callosobruchus chinensis]